MRVAVIFPGAVNTGITDNSGMEMATINDTGRMPILSLAKAATIIIRGIEGTGCTSTSARTPG